MKRFLIILLIVVPFLPVSADGYSHLSFLTSSGIKQIAVSNLQIQVGASTLTAANGSETLSLSLNDIEKMYFSGTDTTTNIENIFLDEDKGTFVYTVTGVQVGVYITLREAIAGLPAGVYVLQQGDVAKQIMLK